MDREDKEKTDHSFRDNEEEVQEEEDEDEEEEEEDDQVKNVPLLAEKIRSMFGLPASERLLGGTVSDDPLHSLHSSIWLSL